MEEEPVSKKTTKKTGREKVTRGLTKPAKENNRREKNNSE